MSMKRTFYLSVAVVSLAGLLGAGPSRLNPEGEVVADLVVARVHRLCMDREGSARPLFVDRPQVEMQTRLCCACVKKP